MEQPVNYASEFLLARYGIDCATLFAPIGDAEPQGASLRGTPMWQAIRRARESDDASLPLGAWVRRLKRAAWGDVACAALDALATQTKDLQLAVWLAEALLHEHGFAGLAAGIAVIDGLSERYWETLYPPLAGSLEHRANLLHWFNEKLLAPVRLVPITAPSDAERTEDGTRLFTWADCEHLRRQQQTGAAASEPADGDAGSIDAEEFAAALAATPDHALCGTLGELEQALVALERLDTTLECCFEAHAPSLGALHALLETIDAFVGAELRRRGIRVESERSERDLPVLSLSPGNEAGVAAAAAARNAAAAAIADATATAATAAAQGGDVSDSLTFQAREPSTRMRAYAQLAEAAATLAEIEPHSPVPYLVRKAVQWGALNTAQLYEELFVLGRGRLSVFEMLGIDMSETSEDAS